MRKNMKKWKRNVKEIEIENSKWKPKWQAMNFIMMKIEM